MKQAFLNSSHTRSLKLFLATCTAMVALAPQQGFAQLSIMGVLDSRPTFQAPAPQPQAQPQRSFQNTPIQTPLSPLLPHLFSKPVAAPTVAPVVGQPQNSMAPAQVVTQRPNVNSSIVKGSSGFSADELGFHKDLGIITASGNVEIISEGSMLVADTVSYNQNNNVVTASGNVQLINPNGEVILTEYLEITSDLKNGIAKKMSMVMADRSLIEAESAERKDARYIVAKNASYSPCEKCKDDPDKPLAWKVSANEIEHDANQQRISYKDIFFEVYDVPILYFPYFSHPDPTKQRETGFLSPSFGSNSSLGGFITTPFFYNISPSKDLTLEPTLYYKHGQPALSAEYRQETVNGTLRLGGSATYANNVSASSDGSSDEFRGHIDSEGLFDIDNTWRWGFDANHATDETYIRRYSITNNSVNSHLVSKLYTEGFRQKNYVKASLNSYQEQRDNPSNNLQDGKADFIFSHMGTPSAAGSYWAFDGSFYAINRDNKTRTTRLAGDTSWVLPYTSNDGDIYKLEANLISAGYYSSNLVGDDFNGDYTGFQGQASPSLSFEWRKPLSRTQMNGRVNEILEPIIKLKASPNHGGNYKIPNEDSQDFEFDDTNIFKTNRFTGLDQIEGGNRVDYGFNLGAYGEDGGFSQMFIGQSYRLRSDETYDIGSGHEDNVSDVVGRIEIQPSNFFDLLYRYRLDATDLDLNRSETTVSFGPASTRMSLSHLYIEGSNENSSYSTREEISGTLFNQISKNWYSNLNGRYRLNDPEGSVSYGGSLNYNDECTVFSLEFKRNFSEDRDIDPTDTISFKVELKNLGTFSSF